MFGGKQLRIALEKHATRLPLALRRVVSPMIDESAEELAYWRLSQRGFKPAAIVDVGAYEGRWARKICRIFPRTPTLMVEAQEQKREQLEAVGGPTIAVIAALSDRQGRDVVFYEMETGSSLLPERSTAPRVERKVITDTLDNITSANLPNLTPLILKLDVQGAELMVLRGGEKTLKHTEILQLEIPLLSYNDGAPTLLETLLWLDERGFVPFDIAGSHRPDGLYTTQIDLLFARKSSPLRPANFRLS